MLKIPAEKKYMINRGANVAFVTVRSLLLLGLSFVLLYPIVYMLVMSFRPPDDIYDPTVIWISNRLTLQNIRNALEYMAYGSAVVNTLKINLVSSVLQVAVCAITGYGFARFEFKGKNLLFFLVIFTIVVPPQIISIPNYVSFQFFDFFGIGTLLKAISGIDIRVSIINTVFAFYLPALLGAGIKSGLFVFIFRQFFRGLPKELEDAAAIDGCGFLSCFLRIILPNAAAVMITVAILSTVWYWNDYFVSSMYLSTNQTVTMALVKLQSNTAKITGEAVFDPYKIVTVLQAGCLLTMTPMVLLYMAAQKFVIKGVAQSGIVG